MTRIAAAAHNTRPTVARGHHELALPPNPTGHTRAPGAGPKPLSPRTQGCWTPWRPGRPRHPRRSLLSAALDHQEPAAAHPRPRPGRPPGQPHHRWSAAARQGYSLQRTVKTLEGAQHPDRDAQFAYLNDQAKAHLAARQPVVSVDTKKKELIGDYANGGAEWQSAGQPVKVKVHDFPDPALGTAIPYGIYDLGRNHGWVMVGTDHDTAAFAVATCAAGGPRSATPPTRPRTGCWLSRTLADQTATGSGRGRPSSHGSRPTRG